MTIEAQPKRKLTQKAKDLWSVLLVLIATMTFAVSFGVATTGNPLAVLTMPHNQSHAVSAIKAPNAKTGWTFTGQRIEISEYGVGGIVVVTRSWDTGEEQPTVQHLQEMIQNAGYPTPTCYSQTSYCEMAVQTTTGIVPISISYHRANDGVHPPHFEVTVVSRN